MNKIIKQKIAVLMIVLVLSIPFYIASVLAQDNVVGQVEVQVANPVESCIAKKEETHAFVEFLDNDVIGTLESIASVLHFSCSSWGTFNAALDLVETIWGFIDENCKDPIKSTCFINTANRKVQNIINPPVEKFCSIVDGCILLNEDIVGALGDQVANLAYKGKKGANFLHISPFDNIYVAMGLMCPTAILFNMRKLKTIYQTYGCCIEQACTNGISPESCDRQFSEATCMYWEGSLFTSLIKIVLSFASKFISKHITEKLIKNYVGTDTFKALKELFSLYNHIQGLQSAFQWMSRTFSEPTCKDLNFAKIKAEARGDVTSKFCNLVQIDLNGDRIFDRIETQCV